MHRLRKTFTVNINNFFENIICTHHDVLLLYMYEYVLGNMKKIVIYCENFLFVPAIDAVYSTFCLLILELNKVKQIKR